MLNSPVISVLILLPLITNFYIVFFKKSNKYILPFIIKIIVSLIYSIFLLLKFDKNQSSYQFVERYKWIDILGLEFYFGIDGISIYFIFLTIFIISISIIFAFFTIKDSLRECLMCLLLTESLCIGAFSSINILLFYIFFEATLIPMYIIIGVFGGEERIKAALKFFLYTLFGSSLFIIFLMYIYTSFSTFDITILPFYIKKYSILEQKVLWFLLIIALGIKIPIVPLHTWLPDAHVQAPTVGSIVLAGILLKLGGYGLLRIVLPLFPGVSQDFGIYVLLLGIFTILYSSCLALVQEDIKKIIAYSSIAHMGYVIASIFTFTKLGMNAGLFQMISHGFISSTLFLVVGILYERFHTKDIKFLGGVIICMPKLSFCFFVAMLANIGFPGTSGFISEFLSILSIYRGYGIILSFLTSISIVLSSLYMLRFYKSVFLGENKNNIFVTDISNYEIFCIIPLCIILVYLGLNPDIIFSISSKSLDQIYYRLAV